MLKINSESGNEPVTQAEAKLWLKLDSDLTEDDDLVELLISDARIYCESYAGRAFKGKNVTLRVDEIPANNKIRLRYAANEVGLAITYSLDEVVSTLATTVYRYNEYDNCIELKANQVFPDFDFMLITYDVINDCSEQIRKCILNYMAENYDYRANGKPMNKGKINAALDQIRLWEFR